jgi:alkaline phosphatase D
MPLYIDTTICFNLWPKIRQLAMMQVKKYAVQLLVALLPLALTAQTKRAKTAAVKHAASNAVNAPATGMGNASGLLSGPMLGHIELRNASVWLEVAPWVKKVELRYHEPGGVSAAVRQLTYPGELGKDFNPVRFDLNGLNMNTTYTYTILLDGQPLPLPYKTQFTTRDLWQWRKPAPDFSFLAGSCAYVNEPVYDRPGKPYGGDSTIFETMAATPAAFHLWLGDNWYTREVDYGTAWGLWYRASHDRQLPSLQRLLTAMPQYAIWDDHDFGPNDGNSSYILKDHSKKVFDSYWCNPSSGEDGKGIYTKLSYSDVDIFMLDDRFFRSADDLPKEVEGQPNLGKQMYGAQQMRWLENALATSNATFKIIATGSQVLNPLSTSDCVRHFPADYEYLMEMLQRNRIRGVLFLTGDRHHSEVIKLERPGTYTLYDITASPYTSGVGKVRDKEMDNPARVPGTLVEAQNFAKLSVSGVRNERVLKVEFLGIKGEKLGEWSVGEGALK